MIVELGRPRYDAATRTLRVSVRRITTSPERLANHSKRADPRLPRSFGRVSLFVDDALPRNVIVRFGFGQQPAGFFGFTLVSATISAGTVSSRPVVALSFGLGEAIGQQAFSTDPSQPFNGEFVFAPRPIPSEDPNLQFVFSWTWPPGASSPTFSTSVRGSSRFGPQYSISGGSVSWGGYPNWFNAIVVPPG